MIVVEWRRRKENEGKDYWVQPFIGERLQNYHSFPVVVLHINTICSTNCEFILTLFGSSTNYPPKGNFITAHQTPLTKENNPLFLDINVAYNIYCAL